MLKPPSRSIPGSVLPPSGGPWPGAQRLPRVPGWWRGGPGSSSPPWRALSPRLFSWRFPLMEGLLCCRLCILVLGHGPGPCRGLLLLWPRAPVLGKAPLVPAFSPEHVHAQTLAPHLLPRALAPAHRWWRTPLPPARSSSGLMVLVSSRCVLSCPGLACRASCGSQSRPPYRSELQWGPACLTQVTLLFLVTEPGHLGHLLLPHAATMAFSPLLPALSRP